MADDETTRKFIKMMTKVYNPIRPKMSLETYINISRAINEELNKFALKWFSKVENFSYDEIFGLLQAESEECPIITKYNCVERAKNHIEFLNGLDETLDRKTANEVEQIWEQKKLALWQFMVPNRYVTEEKKGLRE